MKEYLSISNSINDLQKTLLTFYITSVGFADFYHGITNRKRFIAMILIWVLFMLVTLYHFLFLVSNQLYSLINNYFLPESFRIFLSLVVFVNVFIPVIGFDCIYDETYFKGSVLKIFYYLFNNFNDKLMEQNLRK